MAQPSKLFFAALSFGLVSACSATGDTAAAVSPEAYAAAQTRVASLEGEVVKLKRENARLASKLRTETGTAQALPAEVSLRDGAEPRLPDTPTIVVPARDVDRPATAAIVVDETAPDLKRTDVPVEASPRLVQPTFASTDAVFENEAEEIETASVLFGVHLASYRQIEHAREGWRKLQRENPDELGLLEPRIEPVTLKDKGGFLRLIGGGLSSQDKAESLCAKLKAKSLYCVVTSFDGERLSLGAAQ